MKKPIQAASPGNMKKIADPGNKYLPKITLKLGDPAPEIRTKLQDDRAFELYKVQAKWIVLFFYPQDLSPTCTKEACNLRDHFGNFKLNEIKLFGISPDSAKRHAHFLNKYKLPFDLLMDENHTIATNYQVWSKKKFMGRIFVGMHRTTFVLNNEFKIHHIIYPVVSATHHEQILKCIIN